MSQARTIWTFAITSVALFMVVLDNLVVSTAIPVIRVDLNASMEQLEWTVNAYTLTFAVLLLTGAALGDRFGRRRVFLLRASRRSSRPAQFRGWAAQSLLLSASRSSATLSPLSDGDWRSAPGRGSPAWPWPPDRS
jgi:MFS family permease